MSAQNADTFATTGASRRKARVPRPEAAKAGSSQRGSSQRGSGRAGAQGQASSKRQAQSAAGRRSTAARQGQTKGAAAAKGQSAAQAGKRVTKPEAKQRAQAGTADKPRQTRARPVLGLAPTLAINITIVLAALAVAGLILYPALQEWWQLRRDNQLLEAQNSALIERNLEIVKLIEALNTPEGVESRAREQFGWVMPGEQAVNIVGLGTSGSSTALPDNPIDGSIRPEIDWLTESIDFLLDYHYPASPPAADDVVIGL